MTDVAKRPCMRFPTRHDTHTHTHTETIPRLVRGRARTKWVESEGAITADTECIIAPPTTLSVCMFLRKLVAHNIQWSLSEYTMPTERNGGQPESGGKKMKATAI